MAINRLILWLGYSLVLIAILLSISALCGILMSEISDAILFAAIAVVVGMVGVIFAGTTRHSTAQESNIDALMFLLIFWTFVPLILSLPYFALGQTNSLIYGYFEAVSALTTTGASTLNPDEIPKTLHIWRSLLQWMGGVIVATFAVVILAALNLRGTGVHRSQFFTLRKGELFSRLTTIGRIIASVYAAISLMCFICLTISGTSVFDAFCLSLTSISTGGLTPRGDLIASYTNWFGVVALCIACFLGTCNIAVLWEIIRGKSFGNIRRLITNVEHRALLALISILLLIGLAYSGFSHITTLISEAVFFATGTGFDHNVIGLDTVPSVVLIAFALIGGSALSTAGGLKLIRFLLLFRHIETDLNRLTHPSRVIPVSFRGQILPDREFLSVWMYFFGFTLAFALGIIALSTNGMDFEMAVTTSAASLSNMGPLLDYTLPDYSYSSFTDTQLFLSSMLMLIGRVEVLALIAIFSPAVWRS